MAPPGKARVVVVPSGFEVVILHVWASRRGLSTAIHGLSRKTCPSLLATTIWSTKRMGSVGVALVGSAGSVRVASPFSLLFRSMKRERKTLPQLVPRLKAMPL